MSRNFEDTYKAEVQMNIPDLWNRIESALPEKSVNAEAVKEKVVVKEVTTNFNYKSKKKNKYAWMKWASLAVAALFVVILLPTVAGLGILGLLGSKGSSDMAATESAAAPEMMYQETVEEAAMEEVQADNEGAVKENMAENAEDIYVNMDATAEAPVSDENVTAEEFPEEETVVESIPEDKDENAQGSGSLGDIPLMNDNRTVLAMGMKATVTGCMVSSDENAYCTLWLEIPEEAYETFEGYECFRNGRLEVRYYYDDTNATPERGKTYKFDIIEVGDGSWLVAKLQ